MVWRKRVGELGAALGVVDMDGIRRKLGPKWAYRLREALTLAVEAEWQRVIQSLRYSAGEFDDLTGVNVASG